MALVQEQAASNLMRLQQAVNRGQLSPAIVKAQTGVMMTPGRDPRIHAPEGTIVAHGTPGSRTVAAAMLTPEQRAAAEALIPQHRFSKGILVEASIQDPAPEEEELFEDTGGGPLSAFRVSRPAGISSIPPAAPAPTLPSVSVPPVVEPPTTPLPPRTGGGGGGGAAMSGLLGELAQQSLSQPREGQGGTVAPGRLTRRRQAQHERVTPRLLRRIPR